MNCLKRYLKAALVLLSGIFINLSLLLSTPAPANGSGWHLSSVSVDPDKPECVLMHGEEGDMIDSDLRSYFAAEVFEYEGSCGQIHGPQLRVRLAPDDGSPKQIKEIRVTLHVDHGSVREVDVKIDVLDPFPSKEEWLDQTISDRDVYTWSKTDGRSAPAIYVEIDALRYDDIGALSNAIGIREIQIVEVGAPPFALEVSPEVLTRNDEGWYRENPVDVTVALYCPSESSEPCTGEVSLEMGGEARFHVASQPAFLDELACIDMGDEIICRDWVTDLTCRIRYDNLNPYATRSYSFSCGPVELSPGESAHFDWQVWVQPSTETSLDVSAAWNEEDGDIYEDGTSVSIPQADIHPVVFLHGILGSMPPGNSVITKWPQQLGPGINFSLGPHLDPFLGSYKPLIDNLLKMGYEIDKTLFPVTYDWRQSNLGSAAWLSDVLGRKVGSNGDSVIDLPYVTHDGKADVVVHSMGGMVLRTYIAGMATSGDPEAEDPQFLPYGNNVNRAIFIASPHQGFPFNYATWEGLTWKDYMDEEAEWISGGPLTGWLLDNLLWPYMILERYKPGPLQACAIFPDTPPNRLATPMLCPDAVLYAYSHNNPFDPAHPGIGSLREMLPTEAISPYLIPQDWGIETNYLLEEHGLNTVKKETLKRIGSDPRTYDGVYVLYSDDQSTVVSYNVEEPPQATIPYLFCWTKPGSPPVPVCWSIPSVQRWPYGEVPNPASNDGNQEAAGDDLIPAASTQLFGNDLLDPTGIDLDNQELRIDSIGHIMIAGAEQTQSVVGAILTGIEEPGEVRDDPSLFPFTTPYTPPAILFNNFDVVLAFLVHSPVDIMVTDPQGRRVGYNPASGEIVNEIPGAYYTGNGSDVEFILVGKEDEGDFTVTTTGTRTGEYAVSVHRVGQEGVTTLGSVRGMIEELPYEATAVIKVHDTYSLPFYDDFEHWPVWIAKEGFVPTDEDVHSPFLAWRADVTDATLALPGQIDLSDATNPILTFWHRLPEGGQGAAEVSTDKGETWQSVGEVGGTGYEWQQATLALSAFAGQVITFRFRLVDLGLTENDPAWFIDDVSVIDAVAIAVEIDIRPWRKHNIIFLRKSGLIRVAILSTDDFDAPHEVDRTSLTFGRTGEEPSLSPCCRKRAFWRRTCARDVNRDGLKDLLCLFLTRKTGFQRDDTEGILKGRTVGGVPIEGRDSVIIVGRH